MTIVLLSLTPSGHCRGPGPPQLSTLTQASSSVHTLIEIPIPAEIIKSSHPRKASIMFRPDELSSQRSSTLSGQKETPFVGVRGESLDASSLGINPSSGAESAVDADSGAGECSQQSEANQTISINYVVLHC